MSNNLLKEYYFVCESEKALAMKKERLRAEIIERFKEGTNEADGFQVKVANVNVDRLNTTLLKQHEPETYLKFLKATTQCRISVKPLV